MHFFWEIQWFVFIVGPKGHRSWVTSVWCFAFISDITQTSPLWGQLACSLISNVLDKAGKVNLGSSWNRVHSLKVESIQWGHTSALSRWLPTGLWLHMSDSIGLRNNLRFQYDFLLGLKWRVEPNDPAEKCHFFRKKNPWRFMQSNQNMLVNSGKCSRLLLKYNFHLLASSPRSQIYFTNHLGLRYFKANSISLSYIKK